MYHFFFSNNHINKCAGKNNNRDWTSVNLCSAANKSKSRGSTPIHKLWESKLLSVSTVRPGHGAGQLRADSDTLPGLREEQCFGGLLRQQRKGRSHDNSLHVQPLSSSCRVPSSARIIY